jgi:hypothetical protein
MFSYNNAIETRTMTPLRTQNKIAMAVLPMPNRETLMDWDQFLEQCQTNISSLWEQMVNLHGDLMEQIDQLQGDLAKEQLQAQQQASKGIRNIMAEWDQYARQVAQLVTQQGIGGQVTCKTVKLENPPMLDDGKAVQFND